MAVDLDIRLLRRFVVAAEEQHFTRAAARLFIAQQVLSRDVDRLERLLGVRLFERTTRSVRLTRAGRDLLDRARPLLALHDEVIRDLGGRSTRFLVDPVGPGLTPARIVERARQDEDGYEFYTREYGSLGAAAHQVAAGELDVAFGFWTDEVRTAGAGLAWCTLRDEPLALLVPDGHRWAGPAVRAEDLAGVEICWRAGNQVTVEWDRLARTVLATCRARPAEAHPPVRGVDELGHHVRPDEPSVLTVASHPPVPGATLVPLLGSLPLPAWTMVRRSGDGHPALAALDRAQAALDLRRSD